MSEPRLPVCRTCAVIIPGAEGFMEPTLAGRDRYGVALVGEALGEHESIEGLPFVGPSGFKLTRLIEWAGLDRSRFDIWNTVWTRPPGNYLDGAPYEDAAVQHCREAHWGSLVKRASVIVPMGNVALRAFTGRKGILSVRGYIQGGPEGTHLLPTVHPSFIQRGQSKYSAAFIHDIQKAVELARGGIQFQPLSYLLDPLPFQALQWAREYLGELSVNPSVRLAYDIETPGKGDDEGELSEDDDPTFTIFRISFAYKPFHALSIPWTAPYIPAIKLLLEGSGQKVVWNGSFDNPRIRHNEVSIGGLIHDGMIAWHILHSDLPKGLGFVATFTCPYQPAWKHLSHASPAFYNATDADVELRSMLSIEAELLRTGLWDVYQRDVLDLDPILSYMSTQGMPIDAEIRLKSAIALKEKQDLVLSSMESLYPFGARKVEHVFATTPKETAGLHSRPATRSELACSNCGLARPRKDHFKKFVKKVNLCADAGRVERQVEVVEWFRLGAFKPSRNQLIAYQVFLGRQVPTKWDGKTKTRKLSMDEKALKGLMGKFPEDKLYPAVLEYRELDKLGGTYIGRPIQRD